jgi:hypothetical protein
MKKIIGFTIFLLSSVNFSGLTVFEMELGKTTETQLKSMYNIQKTGINKYSGSNKYSVPISAINFNGLKEVTTTFNDKGVLVAVYAIFRKEKFDYLKQVLDDKYLFINKNIPFVGDKSITYKEGDVTITLDSPHIGFSTTILYIMDDFMTILHQGIETENQQRLRKESSQL